MTCIRSIEFTIPGTVGAPDVNIYVVENNGALVFSLNVDETTGLTADLRGLFFNVTDQSKLAGLSWSADNGTVTDFDTVGVIDLGNGASMQGVASPFDVGLEFGTSGIGSDDIQTASFTLSNAAGDLTLDDIANTLFGARLTSVGEIESSRKDSAKLVALAPAAPDAVDDAYGIFEDGQDGLSDPSSVPEGVLFEVLANDTDADGDTLTVTNVYGAQHGTVQIVDGADADLLPGDAVLYTPFEDYAGDDSFTYCITDNNGGTDYAEVAVAVEAVADIPTLDVQVLAGESVNEIKLVVTATQTDADGSEYIDRMLSSTLPSGVTLVPGSVDPSGQPGQLIQEFLLTLPVDQDSNFDLTLTAVSKETTNGDEEAASHTIGIDYEYNLSQVDQTFSAIDQSIWSTGDEFTFTDNRFLGVDGGFSDSADGLIGYNVSADIKAGLQSTLTFEGGEIDAYLDYALGVATNYNKTTDVLLIDSMQLLTGGDFTTQGPEGSYSLDFIFNYAFNVKLTYDIELYSGNIINVADSGSATSNILDLDSDDLGTEIPFPSPFGSLSASLAWPNISTNAVSTPPPSGEFSASGESNNFLQLNFDLDQALADIFLYGANPFDIEFDIGVVWGSLELADLDLFGGLNFLQSFVMQEQGLAGTILFENGDEQAFVFGDDILLSNASLIDAEGDSDGQIEFVLSLDPQASLHNDTDLGFNLGYNFDVLEVSGGYDVKVGSDSFSFGPVYNTGGALPIGTVGVYDSTFDLNFAAQDLFFYA